MSTSGFSYWWSWWCSSLPPPSVLGDGASLMLTQRCVYDNMEVQQQTPRLSNILDDPSAHQDATHPPSSSSPSLVAECVCVYLGVLLRRARQQEVLMLECGPHDQISQSRHVIFVQSRSDWFYSSRPWTPHGFTGCASPRFLIKVSRTVSLATFLITLAC